jgi:hypothetical protein
VVLAVGAAVVAGIIEHPADPRHVSIGNVRDFALGSVTRVEPTVNFYDPADFDGPVRPTPGDRAHSSVPIYVTHDRSGLHALLARSTFDGCPLAEASPDDQRQATAVGANPNDVVLVDPCHGGAFDIAGHHLAGLGDRDLDSFPVAYEPDGTVTVDVTDLREG